MIRNLRQFHEQKGIIAAAQTKAGKSIVWASGVALLLLHDTTILMPCAFTLVLLFPGRRRVLLALAAVAMILEQALLQINIPLGLALGSLEGLDSSASLWVVVQVAVALVCIYLASSTLRRFDRFPGIIRRFPLVALHVFIWLLLALSVFPPFNIFSFASTLAWRLSYLVAQANRGGAKSATFRDHLFYLVPVFEGMAPPYGKGLDYLTRHEAMDQVAVARSQLAGIKLLGLAMIWAVVLGLMDVVIYGQRSHISSGWPDEWVLGVPRLDDALRLGVDTSMPGAWAGVYLELVRQTLLLASTGHLIVGCIRLMGFNVFRNTYKPLLAVSIVEFWNRYNFYFKEMLVEFFFYPTYFRCSWAGPRLRLFLAVFAAAFLGNMYFHLLLTPELAVRLDFTALWAEWGTRLIYCFLLALGIWLSMLRQQKQRATTNRSSRLAVVRGIAGVWTFYAIIRIWNVRAPDIGFADRASFTTMLVGF